MWNAKTFQVVWFPVVADGFDASDIYAQLLGEAPDSSEKNRVPSRRAPYFGRSIGEIEQLRHSVVVAPGRIDWHIEPLDSDEDHPYSNLLDTSGTLGFIKARLAELPPEVIGDVTRLSVVTNLVHPFESLEEARKEFVSVARLPVDPEGLMDLSFQINKRVASDHELEFNRLSRLSIETVTLLQVNFDARLGAQQSSANTQAESHAMKLLLDFNSVPTGRVIAKGLQAPVISSLCDEAEKMAKQPSIDFYKG